MTEREMLDGEGRARALSVELPDENPDEASIIPADDEAPELYWHIDEMVLE